MEFELEEWLIEAEWWLSPQLEPTAPAIPRPRGSAPKPDRLSQFGVLIPEESTGGEPADLRSALTSVA